MRHHILIVADHEDDALALALFVRQLGYEASIAAKELAALEAIIRESPMAAMIDISSRASRALAFAAALRSRVGPTLPIIALSVFSSVEYRHQAHEAGVDTYFVKPADLDAIETTLDCVRRSETS